MRKALSVLGGSALAVCLSQFPEYAQQYTQRLGGAIDELQTIIADFDRGAAEFGLTRQEALARYDISADLFLHQRGQSMERTFSRYDELQTMLARVQGAGPIERAQLLPQFLDTDIGGRTLDNFKPAVPVTPEGFLWAGAGLMLGYIVISALVSFCTLPFRRRKRVVVYRERRPDRSVSLAERQEPAPMRQEPVLARPAAPLVEDVRKGI